jgi:hypothetical protein
MRGAPDHTCQFATKVMMAQLDHVRRAGPPAASSRNVRCVSGEMVTRYGRSRLRMAKGMDRARASAGSTQTSCCVASSVGRIPASQALSAVDSLQAPASVIGALLDAQRIASRCGVLAAVRIIKRVCAHQMARMANTKIGALGIPTTCRLRLGLVTPHGEELRCQSEPWLERCCCRCRQRPALRDWRKRGCSGSQT